MVKSFQLNQVSAGDDYSSPLLECKDLAPRLDARPDRAKALVFEDPVSKQLLEQIERIAATDATVLITGENGTGKALVAKHIHAISQRHRHVFGVLNCSALSESLIESELFGFEKGSFSGAVTNKEGWFQSANRGSVFLDEVGDLPLNVQVKLLRVLQERQIVKLGGSQALPVNVRVIAATKYNLGEAVATGRFRADLYYQFNVATIHLRPLRERPGDILPLAKHFLKFYGERSGRPDIKLSPESESVLLKYDWPGNIGELESAVQRAILVSGSNVLQAGDFKLSALRVIENKPAVSTSSLEEELLKLCQQAPEKLYELIEETAIRTAFKHCEENQVHTAKLLNISRNVLRHKLEIYGMLPVGQKRVLRS